MLPSPLRIAALLLAVGLTAPQAASPPAADLSCTPSELAGTGLAGRARLLPGTGSYRLAKVSSVPEAQRYFDQGVILAIGFNFAESVRSFSEASRRDPQCAMCRWGIAWARGPSVNHDMSDVDGQAAFEAAAVAQALSHRSSDRERALIAALATRYADDARAPREPFDRAYAEAMRALASRYADDADILTLAADALMAPIGRDFWTTDGKPRPWTPEISGLLERALILSPRHPGAMHYWIHLHEFGPTPEKALKAAEHIGSVAPGVGHLVHMPAHTYARLGRWADAVDANRRAIAADLAYLRTAGADREYAAGYVAHNYHFLWSVALMAGDEPSARLAADVLAAGAAAQGFDGSRGATQQHFRVLPLLTLVRFGRWGDILAAARPAPSSSYTDALWHWSRAIALARTAQSRQAREELVRAQSTARDPRLAELEFKSANALDALLRVALPLAGAEVSLAQGRPGEAIEHARAAVKAEDALAADEPEAWSIPARQFLGAIYLDAGRLREARSTFADDLARHPANGWSLAGMTSASSRSSPRGAFPPGRH